MTDSLKTFFILYAKRNESGSLNEVSCPKEGSEMNDFFLNQGKSFKAWAPNLYPNFP